MPDAAAIIVRDLVRGFPGVKAVDRLSFEVNYGEIFGLVGPDGAGKTTTMRILAGVLLPDARHGAGRRLRCGSRCRSA